MVRSLRILITAVSGVAGILLGFQPLGGGPFAPGTPTHLAFSVRTQAGRRILAIQTGIQDCQALLKLRMDNEQDLARVEGEIGGTKLIVEPIGGQRNWLQIYASPRKSPPQKFDWP